MKDRVRTVCLGPDERQEVKNRTCCDHRSLLCSVFSERLLCSQQRSRCWAYRYPGFPPSHTFAQHALPKSLLFLTEPTADTRIRNHHLHPSSCSRQKRLTSHLGPPSISHTQPSSKSHRSTFKVHPDPRLLLTPSAATRLEALVVCSPHVNTSGPFRS